MQEMTSAQYQDCAMLRNITMSRVSVFSFIPRKKAALGTYIFTFLVLTYLTFCMLLSQFCTGWCRPAKKAPQCVWDDAGTAGKRGSFWFVNSLHTLYVVEGHAPPTVSHVYWLSGQSNIFGSPWSLFFAADALGGNLFVSHSNVGIQSIGPLSFLSFSCVFFMTARGSPWSDHVLRKQVSLDTQATALGC